MPVQLDLDTNPGNVFEQFARGNGVGGAPVRKNASPLARPIAAPAPAPAPKTAYRPTAVAPVASATGQYSYASPGIASAPSQNDFVAGDTDYLGTQDAVNRLKAAFEASQLRQKGMLEQNTVEQTDGLNRQSGIDLHDMLENFAGRGVLYSGRYGDDQSQLRDAYSRRLAAVQTNKANTLQSMQDQKNDFYTSQDDQLATAKNAAVQRYLQQFMAGGAA